MQKSREEWRQILSPEQFAVLREKATEAPFSGEYDGLYADGVYACLHVARYYLTVLLSLMPTVAGQAFTIPNLMQWSFIPMKVMVWCVLK